MKIHLTEGCIEEQKTDVIVNTTNDALHLAMGEMSKAILKAAGVELQEECKDKYPSGIKVGEVAETGGGKLSCKNVYHIPLEDTWNTKETEIKQTLRDVVNKCLNMADKAKMKSITFPAPGTGKLNYSPEQVADIMFEVVTDFYGITLNVAYFVIHPSNTNVWKAFCKVKSSKESTGRLKIEHPYCWVRGDLQDQMVNVIVNSIPGNLDLSHGPMSKAILLAAGSSIQFECWQNYPGGITFGVIAVTSGGDMKVKEIYHVSLPKWNAQDKTIKEKFKDVIVKCLEKANQSQNTSIAIPFLGTGVLEYPPDIVTELLYQALEGFHLAKPNRSLIDIRVVVRKEDQANLKALQKSNKIKEMLTTSFSGESSEHLSEEDVVKRGDVLRFSNKPKDKGWKYILLVLRRNSRLSLFKKTSNIIPEHKGDVKLKDVYEGTKVGGDTAKIVGRPKDAKVDLMLAIPEASNQSSKIHWFMFETEQDFKEWKHEMDLTIQGQCKTAAWTKPRKRALTLPISLRPTTKQNTKEKQIQCEKAHGPEAKTPPPTLPRTKLPAATPRSTAELTVPSVPDKPQKPPRERVSQLRHQVAEKLNDPKRNSIALRGLNITKQGVWLPALSSIPLRWTDQLTASLDLESDEATNIIAELKKSLGKSSCIVKMIHRIQNRGMYESYQRRRKAMDLVNDSIDNERSLWHGTSSDAIDNINSHGFNRSYRGKHGTKYGQGVYFAKNASYSVHFSSPNVDGNGHMYSVKVLTGLFAAGSKNMIEPPIRFRDKQGLITRYDSVVDDVNNPSIFTVFKDDVAYPEYLITFIC